MQASTRTHRWLGLLPRKRTGAYVGALPLQEAGGEAVCIVRV